MTLANTDKYVCWHKTLRQNVIVFARRDGLTEGDCKHGQGCAKLQRPRNSDWCMHNKDAADQRVLLLILHHV